MKPPKHVPGPWSTPQVFFLPNLMTAGNLACGFSAIVFIFEGMRATDGDTARLFYYAIFAILGACLFDALDGRMARIRGQESMFGREFDSLADIVSFGIAPALLVMDIVTGEFNSKLGWGIAFIYLLCGGMRLARFNCLSQEESEGRLEPNHRDFVGFPIPAAAGLIATLTMLLLFLNGEDKAIGFWKYLLLALMLLLSFLMLSEFRYPSFKRVDWRSRRSLIGLFVVIMTCVLAVLFYEVVPFFIFMAYLTYGLMRPWISMKWQKKIEEGPEVEFENELSEVVSGESDDDESVA